MCFDCRWAPPTSGFIAAPCQSALREAFTTQKLNFRRLSQMEQCVTAQLGRFVFNQSFKAPSMRVCQPDPVALKALITSGDKRMVVICLVGVFCGPRCFMPKVFCKLAGKTSWAGLNRRKSASLSSRTSPSSLVRGVGLHLSQVGFAKTDDTDTTRDWGEAQHVQAM